MGQKIHPTGFRLPVTRAWASRWYASNRNFSQMLAEDLKVREFLKAKLKNAAVSRILRQFPGLILRVELAVGAKLRQLGIDLASFRQQGSPTCLLGRD